MKTWTSVVGTVAIALLTTLTAHATPFASCISNINNTIYFNLNESGGNVTVTYEDGTTNANFNGITTGLHVGAGYQHFDLNGHTSYAISVFKKDFGIPGMITSKAQSTARGIAANVNPTSPYFGYIYSVVGGAGVVVMRSDGTGGGNGSPWPNTVATPPGPGVTWNTGDTDQYFISVAPDDYVLVSDYGVDGGNGSTGGIIRVDPQFTSSALLLSKITNLVPNDTIDFNHGTAESRAILTAGIGSNATLYVVDGTYSTPYHQILKYNLGAANYSNSTLPWTNQPDAILARVDSGARSFGNTLRSGLSIGTNGYFYVSADRPNRSKPNLQVYDMTGTNLVWSSSYTSNGILRDCIIDGTMIDGTIRQYESGSGASELALSPDNRYIALVHDDNHITIFTLTNGIPDISTDHLITATQGLGTTATGRGICWDAADNLWIASDGLGSIYQYSIGATATAITTGNASGTTGFQLLSPGTEVDFSVVQGTVTPGHSVTNKVTRTGDLSSSVSVPFTLSGTARRTTYNITPVAPLGTSFSVTTNSGGGTINFTAGPSTANVIVTAIDDGSHQSGSLIMTLQNSGSGEYTVGPQNQASNYINEPCGTTSSALTSLINCLGTSATFTETSTGTGPFTYVWKKDGTVIGGQTTSAISIASVAQADAGTYTVEVTGQCTSTTNSATLTISTPTSATAFANLVACAGQSSTFATAASGSGPFSYVWRKNGTVIVGASANMYTIAHDSMSDAGTYTVEVYGACTSVTNSATLTVLDTAATSLTSTTVCPGQSATFSTVASGAGPFTYVWRKNGIVQSSTSNSLTIVSAATSDPGTYTVEVTGTCNTVTNAATLTLNPLADATPLTNKLATAGQTVTFVTVASGTGPFSYLWSKDGQELTNQTDDHITLSNLVIADSGTYSVQVSGACNVTNQSATLDVGPLPALVGVPADTTASCDAVPGAATPSATGGCNGAPTIAFTEVETAGPCANRYTLLRTWTATDACNSSSSASQTITVIDTTAPVLVGVPADATVDCNQISAAAAVTATDVCDANPLVTMNETSTRSGCGQGDYAITRIWTATDACGNTSTQTQHLSVIDVAPHIISGPVGQTINAGDTLNLAVSAVGTNLNYQWKQNGTNIAHATNDTFVVTNALRANAGVYTVVLSGISITNSDPATVTVTDPVITNQPVSGNGPVGSKFTFTIGATGTHVPGFATGLHYQWYFSRFGGPGPKPMIGRTNAFLKFNPVNIANAGSYFCVVTNRFLPGEIATANGNIVTSVVATLTTYYPPTIQTQPTSITRTVGNRAPFVVLAYGTAPFSYQWNFNGVTIPGATTSSYIRSNVQMSDAGTYTCTITGTLDATTRTSIANGQLTVIADTKSPKSVITYPPTAITLTAGAVRSNANLSATAPDTILAGGVVDDGAITNISLIQTFPPWATNEWDVTPQNQPPTRQSWATNVTLVSGTNIFVATATDESGKTNQSNPRIIFLREPAALTVNVNGSGKTVAVGKFNGVAKNGALLDVNRGYNIKALPTTNTANFVSWTDGLGTVLTNAPTLHFVMTNGLILNANFDR